MLKLNEIMKNKPSFLLEYHKAENLDWQAVPIHKIANARKRWLYRSPSRSRYFVADYENNIVLVRISNHWGVFHTNGVYDSDEMEYERQKHVWNLNGGDNDSRRFQAGFIVIEEPKTE